MRGLIIQLPARVIVDTNRFSRHRPDLSVASFADADRIPEPGEFVFAVQPDPDGADYQGSARVEFVEPEHRLIYLRVDWTSFSESRPPVTRWVQGILGDEVFVRADMSSALRAEPLADAYRFNHSGLLATGPQ